MMRSASWRTHSNLRKLWDLLFDFIERVELPMRIEIRNNRLGFLWKLLQLPVVGFIIFLCFFDQSALYIQEPNKKGVSAMEVRYDPARYRERTALDWRNGSFCTNPEIHDYIFDSNWNYEGYSCASLPRDRRDWREGANMMYIPLSFVEHEVLDTALPPIPGNESSCYTLSEGTCTGRDAQWSARERVGASPGSSNDIICECTRSANKFIAGVQSAAITFEHLYELYRGQLGFLSFGSAQASFARCSEAGWACQADCEKGPFARPCTQQDREMLSLVLVRRGIDEEELLGSFYSPNPIELSLERLLEIAGHSLDDVWEDTKENLLHCRLHEECDQGATSSERCQSLFNVRHSRELSCRNDTLRYPLLRQMGVVIRINLQYVNRNLYGLVDTQGHIPPSHIGPVCKVSISVQPEWAGRPKVDCKEDGAGLRCSWRYFYGVQVIFTSSSSYFGYTEYTRFLITLGGGLVYFALPLLIVQTLAMFLLGPVSDIYFAAWKKYVHVGNELAGMIFRLCSAVAAFRTLSFLGRESTETQTEEPGRLDDDGIPKDVFFNCIHDGTGIAKHSESINVDGVKLAELMLDRIHSADGEKISLPEYVYATTYLFEAVEVKSVVGLFDVQRRRGLFERIFNPTQQLKGNRHVYERRRHTNSKGFIDEEFINSKLQEHRKKMLKRLRQGQEAQASEAAKDEPPQAAIAEDTHPQTASTWPSGRKIHL